MSTLVNILLWLPTILFIICILSHIISGARRGLSKSIKLFITFVIAIIVALFFYFIVRNQDYDSLFVKYGNQILSSQGKNMTTFFEQIIGKDMSDHAKLTEYFQEMLSKTEYFQESVKGLSLEEAARLLFSLSMLLVNLVIFVLAFIVFFLAKFVLYIFYLIFFREGRRRNRINREFDRNERNTPYKPHRLGGLFVGLVRGLIVGILGASVFGTLSLLVSNNEYATNVNDKSNVNGDTAKNITEVYYVVDKWDSVGINKVLGSLKTKENLPYYLIVADKLLTTEYTYEENGETKKVTLNLSTDLAPITSVLSSTAYLMLMYGFEPNKQYTQDEIAAFIASDKEVDGYTLQTRIDDLLNSTDIGDYTNFLLDSLVVNFTVKYCNGVEDSNSSEYKDLNLSQKLLYQLFIGSNCLKATNLINNKNMSAAFNAFVHILTHKEEIDSIKKVFDQSTTTTTSRKLALGVYASTTPEEVTKAKNIVDYLHDDLKKLSFYEEDFFQRLLSDIVKTVIETQFTEFDLTSILSGKTVYDISWSDSLDTVFKFLSDLVGIITSSEIENTNDLLDRIIMTFNNPNDSLIVDLISICDSSAGSILLNTYGFNDIINKNLNTMIKGALPNATISPIITNYASYTTDDGVVVDGELKKIIKSMGSVIYNIYTISKDSTIDSNQKLNNIIKAVSSDENVCGLVTTDDKNHSNFVHVLLSDIISNIEFNYNSSSFSMYIPEESYETLNLTFQDDSKVINSSEFTNILKFLSDFTKEHSISDFQNGDINKICDIVLDFVDLIKQSKVILANISCIIYTYKDIANLTIPESLNIAKDSEKHLEKNINNWIGENGEMNKLLDIIGYSYIDDDGIEITYIDVFKDLFTSSSDYNKYLLEIIKSAKGFIEKVCDSDLINATITKALSSAEAIFIPNESYKELNVTIKSSEIIGLIDFVKIVLNITETTTTLAFDAITSNLDLSYYSDKKDDLLELFNSNIVNATVAFTIVKNSLSSTQLVIPKELVFDKENRDNVDNWLAHSDNIGETKRLVTSVFDLGLLATFATTGVQINDSILTTLTNDKIIESLDSKVLHASIINFFNENKPAALYVPSKYNATRDNIVNDFDNLNYVKNKEIIKLIIGIKEVGLSITTASFDMNTLKELNQQDGNQSKLSIILQSDILYYSISQYVLNVSVIDIPLDVKTTIDEQSYLVKEEITNLIDSITAINVDSFDSITINSLLTNVDLDKLLKSNIIWYTISNKLIDTTGINIPNTVKNKNDNNEVYILRTEIKALISSINMLSLTDVEAFEANSILSTSLDVNQFLESQIIWYTTTKKLISLSTITITSDICTRNNNDEYFISKSELEAFISGITIFTTSFEVINVDATKFVQNSTSLINSSIIRNLITEEIMKNNDLLISRTDLNTLAVETYVNSYQVLGETGLSGEVYQISAGELINFVSAIKLIFGEENASFNIDYSTIDITHVNVSIFDSSIICLGLQDTLLIAITNYNNYNTHRFEPAYGYSYKIYHHDTNQTSSIGNKITREEAKDFIQNYLGL